MENLEARTDDGARWEWLGIRPRRDGMAVACVMGNLVNWLRENRFAVTTSRHIVRAGLRLGAWMSEAGVALEDLDADVIAAMIAADHTAHPSHRVSNESTSAVVGFLKSAGTMRAHRNRGCSTETESRHVVARSHWAVHGVVRRCRGRERIWRVTLS